MFRTGPEFRYAFFDKLDDEDWIETRMEAIVIGAVAK